MPPRDYVNVDLRKTMELNELEYGHPFIYTGFLCIELDPETNLLDTSILDKKDAVCFCFNTNDLMIIDVFSRVQPVRKIKIEIEKV